VVEGVVGQTHRTQHRTLAFSGISESLAQLTGGHVPFPSTSCGWKRKDVGKAVIFCVGGKKEKTVPMDAIGTTKEVNLFVTYIV